MKEIEINLKNLNNRLKLARDLKKCNDQCEIFELMLLTAKQQGFFDGFHWDSRIESWCRND